MIPNVSSFTFLCFCCAIRHNPRLVPNGTWTVDFLLESESKVNLVSRPEVGRRSFCHGSSTFTQVRTKWLDPVRSDGIKLLEAKSPFHSFPMVSGTFCLQKWNIKSLLLVMCLAHGEQPVSSFQDKVSEALRWGCVVVDEVHQAKNPKGQLHKERCSDFLFAPLNMRDLRSIPAEFGPNQWYHCYLMLICWLYPLNLKSMQSKPPCSMIFPTFLPCFPMFSHGFPSAHCHILP